MHPISSYRIQTDIVQFYYEIIQFRFKTKFQSQVLLSASLSTMISDKLSDSL